MLKGCDGCYAVELMFGGAGQYGFWHQLGMRGSLVWSLVISSCRMKGHADKGVDRGSFGELCCDVWNLLVGFVNGVSMRWGCCMWVVSIWYGGINMQGGFVCSDSWMVVMVMAVARGRYDIWGVLYELGSVVSGRGSKYERQWNETQCKWCARECICLDRW